MSNKISESIDVKELINTKIDIFIPNEDDFKQIVIWYLYALDDIKSPTNNSSIEELLSAFINLWTITFNMPEEKISMLIKRLTASIVLQIKEFSKLLLDETLKHINKNELKEILNKLSDLAKSFEKYRAIYSDKLKSWSNNSAANGQNGSNTNKNNSSNSKYWISTKSPEGWRRTIYLDKKKANGEYSVKIGGAEYTKDCGYDAIPLFDSTQQATDFVNNIKAGKSSTRRSSSYVSLFTFIIVDINNRKYSQSLYKQNLQDYVLVNTECGEAYININAKCF